MAKLRLRPYTLKQANLPLTCAFGEPWVGPTPVGGYHCIKCAKWGLQSHREFLADVEAGKHDQEGYTPTEREAKQKRDAQQ